MKILRTLAALALAVGTQACASVVSDTESATYIETDPEKARCELHGQDFKRIVETPNSLNLPAKAAPLTIACKANGYKTTTEKLDTETDGWIFGNILLGGIIGIAIDAARGAGQKYPPKVSVILTPEQFATVASRDEFYDRRKKVAEEKWSKAIGEIESRCSPGADSQPVECSGDVLDKAKAERNKEIAQLEIDRTSSIIGGPTAMPIPAAMISPSPQGKGDVSEQLKSLKKMQDDGLITPADYEIQKQRLLQRL